MYTEEALLPLSALQHLRFCERQCALIHIEQAWQENRLTVEGRTLHRKVHKPKPETRDGVRITRSLPIRSYVLGLTGQGDVITWEPPPGLNRGEKTLAELIATTPQPELQDWKIVPIEYKRGRPKSNDCDRVQLCAQAICLEEMLNVAIAHGELFYGKMRRRVSVPLGDELRKTTIDSAHRLHELLNSGVTPPAVRERKCDRCSLQEICLPEILGRKTSALNFVERIVSADLDQNTEEQSRSVSTS